MKRNKPASIDDRPARVPTFASVEEEAAFWDTHDSTEFEDEFEDAPNVRFVPEGTLSATITIRVDPEMLAALRERARLAGSAPEVLVRQWIADHLRIA
jgi:hypothetical protein